MKIYRICKFTLFLLFCLLLPFQAGAVLFTAPNKAFTVDLPSGWKVSSKKNTVLFAENTKAKASMTVTSVSSCSKLDCLEKLLNKDIASAKAKKYKIIKNTYTGDIIKHTEFSTSDPLISFNYKSSNTDMTAGYFLADLKAYKVEIKGIQDKEAEYILSFISPAPHSVGFAGAGGAAEINDLQMGDISLDDQPVVDGKEDIFDRYEDHHLDPVLPAAAEDNPSKIKIKKDKQKVTMHFKSPGKAGYLIIVVLVYLLVVLCLFAFRTFFPAKQKRVQANPRSAYPVRGTRFYGSPDLFFRFYDNQGENYIATAPRWGGIFTGLGFFAALLFFMFNMLLCFLDNGGYLKIHPVLITTLVSLCELFTVFGLLVFAAGLFTSFLFGIKFYFYSDKGNLSFRCVQQGVHLKKEEYAVANSENAILFRISRERFRLTRRWSVYKGNEVIATIKEASLKRAILRKCFGHLCGFLRTDYTLTGRVDCKGSIKYEKNIFVNLSCDIDKPEAIDSKTLMIVCAVISMRDRDKWYPWVN